MRDIAIYFTTIMLEAIPFLLLGALISAIIEEFVSEERISKMIPKNRVLGSLVGIFLGLFIPACDCAVIPIAMRLKKKKVPTNVIVSFMLASPIISPVVLLSTFFAFGETEKMLLFGLEMPKLFVYRTIFGILVALVVGIIFAIISDLTVSRVIGVYPLSMLIVGGLVIVLKRVLNYESKISAIILGILAGVSTTMITAILTALLGSKLSWMRLIKFTGVESLLNVLVILVMYIIMIRSVNKRPKRSRYERYEII